MSKFADPTLGQKSILRPVLKADPARHLVYGVVLEPDTEDLQGDVISAEDIEKAAHRFMIESRMMGEQHEKPADAAPVESYIAPADIKIGDQTVKAGSWVLVTKIFNVDLWDAIVSGSLQSYSIGGVGNREPLEGS